MPKRIYIPRDPIKCHLLVTGQTTSYMAGDDGDRQKGITKAYTVNSTGSQSETVNVDCPHYAAATIAFVAATDKITDSANGLVTILTGDTIVIKGGAHDGTVYTVKTGGVAGEIVTNEDITANETAGSYITICKRATHSNNVVKDEETGLEWARYVQTGKIGPASDGKLNWYDATKCYTLHPAAADLAMVAGNILRVTGSDESSRYFAGQVLVCSGFANAVNLLPGLVIVSVSFTGGNTDIVVDPGNQTLIAEAAAGSRMIKIVCQNIFAYAAAANAAGLGGHSDWRVANLFELINLWYTESVNYNVDSIAFPTGWNINVWSGTTDKNLNTYAFVVCFDVSVASPIGDLDKLTTKNVTLVRGGG